MAYPWDPAVAIEHVEPVRENIDGDGRIPTGDEKIVETLVPKETTWKERTRWNGGVETRRPVAIGNGLIGVGHERLTGEIGDAAEKITQRRTGEMNVFVGHVLFGFQLESVLEALIEVILQSSQFTGEIRAGEILRSVSVGRIRLIENIEREGLVGQRL